MHSTGMDLSGIRRYELRRFLSPPGQAQAIATAIAIVAIIVSPLPLRILFGYLFLVGVGVRLLDGGYVDLTSRGLRLTGLLRASIKYSKIQGVEAYTPVRRTFGAGPALTLRLREASWVFLPLPIPILFKKGTIRLYLREEDFDSFTTELARCLSS